MCCDECVRYEMLNYYGGLKTYHYCLCDGVYHPCSGEECTRPGMFRHKGE